MVGPEAYDPDVAPSLPLKYCRRLRRIVPHIGLIHLLSSFIYDCALFQGNPESIFVPSTSWRGTPMELSGLPG